MLIPYLQSKYAGIQRRQRRTEQNIAYLNIFEIWENPPAIKNVIDNSSNIHSFFIKCLEKK